MNYQDWLKQLKVGDKVIYHAWGFYSYYSLSSVEKITPTGFIRVDGVLFRPDDGHSRNGGARILNPDDEKSMNEFKSFQKECFVNSMMKKIRNTNINDVTYDQAVEIAKIMGWEV